MKTCAWSFFWEGSLGPESESTASTWKMGERKSSRKASPPLGPTMSETLEILRMWWWRWWWCLWYNMTVKILSETITSPKKYHDVNHYTLVYENVCFYSSCCLFEILRPEFNCSKTSSFRLPCLEWDEIIHYPYIWIYMEWDMIKVILLKMNCFEKSSVWPIAIFLFCFV